MSHFVKQNKQSFVSLLRGALFLVFALRPAIAACGSGSPSVVTDKPDYGHLETAVISGAGFDCGQTLYVLVTAPDGSTRSGNGAGSPGPDSVTTDASGAFVLSYSLAGTLPGGGNYSGQLGIYRVDVKSSLGAVLSSASFRDGVGNDHYCILTSLGGVKCWGSNTDGQLGDGTMNDSTVPVDVVGLGGTVKQVSVGYFHTCALTTAGGVKCWGLNGYGQLGNGSFTNSATPVDVSGLTGGVGQISSGAYHTCAVTSSGGAKCWGYNVDGELGNGSFAQIAIATPGDVSGLTSGVASISSGSFHICALTTAGAPKCWGYNFYGQLGNGGFTRSGPVTGIPTPGSVSGLAGGVAQIGAGGYHTCVVTTGGGVKCWGFNQYGQVGTGSFSPNIPNGLPTPNDVSGLTSSVTQISSGVYHTCALTIGGGAKCWGYNNDGELGRGTFNLVSPFGIATAADVTGLTSGIIQVGAAAFHSCALTTSGGVNCWGYNFDGELGNGSVFQVPPYGIATPGNVSGLTTGVAALPDLNAITPLDTIAPSASPTQSPSANAAGWNSTDVTVTWHWTDNPGGSGIDSANCTASSASSGEGSNITLTATCKDLAGNTGNASYGVKVDKTNPTIGISAKNADNSSYSSGMWTNQTVTVHYTCADSLSGILSCPVDQIFSSDTSSSVNGTATDIAGNSAGSSFILVRIDKTNPTITASATKSDNTVYTAGTWTNQTVTVHFTCSDAGSGIASCPPDQVFSAEGTKPSASGQATDNAGNTASASFGPIQIDKTNPTISASATKADNTPYAAGSWTNQTVTVHFTCGDSGGSGVTACPVDQVFSASAVTPSASGQVTDNAGNNASASFGPIQVDKTNPTISASATKPDTTVYTAGTWTNQTVTVHFTCSDAGSGIASCPPDQVFSAEGTTPSTTGQATDNAGNTATATFGPIQIDKTNPTISASATKADNTAYAAGSWTNQTVTIHFSCGDPGGSGVASCPADQVFSTSAVTPSASGQVTDNAGNSASASFGPIQVDKTNPTITASATKSDNTVYTAGTWTNQTVTVHFTCSDAGSGIASCPPDQVFSAEGTTPSTTGQATDNAGNTATASFGPIQIDKTNPTISASATKADNTAYAAGSWTNQTVTVHFTCGDPGGSGVTACPVDQVFSASGVTPSVSGMATDAAGNSSNTTFGPIQIDKVAPALSPAVTPNPIVLNGSAAATPGAADALSGLASQSCGPVVTSSIGPHSVVCTATDNAGNTTTVSVPYSVSYSFSGFLSPVNSPPIVNSGKSGRTYPIKWQLVDAAGAPQGSLSAVTSITYVATSCSDFSTNETSALDTSATGGTGLRYDSAANQFIYNWASPAAGCYTLFVNLDSGQVFTAFFNLK